MSRLLGKLEAKFQIPTSAKKVHEIFHKTPHHISNVSSDKVQGVELHEGEWGQVGSIICWNYVHDGKPSMTREIVEAVDEEKNSITFKVIEGDLSEEYKSFKFILQCIPMEKGSVVHWTLEYEKKHHEIPDPHSLLQLLAEMTKEIDAHLMEVDANNLPIAARA